MKPCLSFKTICLSLVSAFLFASCSHKDQDAGSTTYFGTTVQMGDGAVRSFVVLAPDRHPLSIGYELTANALVNLPKATHEDSMALENGQMAMAKEYLVPLPDSARPYTVFDHLAANWNPLGHTPVGVYNRPHFDFHFYNMKLADREAIPGYMTDSSGFNNLPAAAYLPTDYIRVPGGEMKMGTHWADKTAPELNGGSFTQTFIYGTYNGKVTFYEPMVTLAFLQQASSFTGTIKQPAQWAVAGYYPTRYSVYTNSVNGYRYVVLDNFVQR
jgi:hypothetical protein